MKKLLLSIICSVLFSGTAFSQIWVSANMQDTPCNSNCSGVLTITAGGTGGVYPLSIIVNGNFFASFMTSFQVDTMCPGTYDISVLDATGFDISGPMIMTVTSIPTPITSVLVQNASCPTCNDGSITATTLSGEPPYTYSLSNGSTGSVIQNLLPGMYILLTVDIHGCTDHDTINIGSGATGLHNETGSENWFSLFPNPSSGDVIVKLNADKTGDYNMNIFDAAGRLVIQKELKGQDHLSLKTEWLTPGIYIIELKSNDTGAKAHKKLIRY